MPSVAFSTLGCKLNFSETSTLARQFQDRDFQRVDFHEPADVYVINTCSVTQSADKKCRKLIKEVKSLAPDSYVIVVGCYAQLQPKQIADIPGVNAVMGTKEKFSLWHYLPHFENSCTANIFHSEIKESKAFFSTFSIEDRTRSFLKIQDGCNYGCSFCTIPLARGKSRSQEPEKIIETIRFITDKGIKEIVLSGINIGDYGIIMGKRKTHFLKLLQDIEKQEIEQRLRISSIEPNLLIDEIIEMIGESKKFVPHFHIPLQSASNKILRAMSRRYDSELYRSRVLKILKKMPFACIGADVLVGFPGETEADFSQTYTFIENLELSYLHIFPYSVRPNTQAASHSDKVGEEVKKMRVKKLRTLSEKKKIEFYQKNEGRCDEILFEKENKNGYIYGFSKNYIRVKQKYCPTLVNQIVPLRYEKMDKNTEGVYMKGEILKN